MTLNNVGYGTAKCIVADELPVTVLLCSRIFSKRFYCRMA